MHYNGFQCIRCPQNQYWSQQTMSCSCPPNQYWSGLNCIECTGQRIWNPLTRSCACRNSMHWDGTSCTLCPNGQNWNGYNCQGCRGGQIWSKINNLDKLMSISLAECRICDLGPPGHLNNLLSNLKVLSLENNLISQWDQIYQLGS